VDQFWSDTVSADAPGAQKAAGLEETLALVILRANPQAGPVVASRSRYTQQMIQEPATHASALFLWEYADARQVSQSGNHVPYAILCSPGKGQTHRGQCGFLPLGYRQVCPRESRPVPQSSRMFGGLPRAVGRDPHLDSRIDLDKCRPSIARHSSLSIGIGSGGIRLTARRYRVCVGRSGNGTYACVGTVPTVTMSTQALLSVTGLTRRVFAHQAVDRLADQVGMAGVAGVLLDHVDHHPTQVGRLGPVRGRQGTV